MNEPWSIVVCVKQVPDADDVTIDPNTGTLNRSEAAAVLNPPDRNAIEAALALKSDIEATVTTVTMGPPGATAVLEVAVAMGADDAALVTDRAFAGSDTWPTSLALAETAAYFDADVVLCGEETTDSSTGQVPPGIAAHNEWAQLTYATELEAFPAEGRLAGTRMIEGGYERVIADLPVVVAVGYGENEPRPAGLHRKIYAEKDFEPIELDAEELGIDHDTVGLQASPTKVGGQETVQPVSRDRNRFETIEELADRLLADEVIA